MVDVKSMNIKELEKLAKKIRNRILEVVSAKGGHLSSTLGAVDLIYTKPDESRFDYFVAGHSSTSISVAVGAAKAIRLKNENRIPVVLIGDGAMSAGMVYEALNEVGDIKLPVVIILVNI